MPISRSNRHMHAFSVELKSVDYLKGLTMLKKTHESFLLEGKKDALVGVVLTGIRNTTQTSKGHANGQRIGINQRSNGLLGQQAL